MQSARTLRPDDGLYPDALARCAERPAELRLRGSLGGQRRVALVGARATDEYGADLARELAGGLARAGVSVVSGGALGIDAVVHEAALEAGGHTIAVLGTGVDVAYPVRHRGLFERILAAGGALLSQFPDGTRPFQSNFPARNRIIAALAEAVVVVRAGRGSGALITASWARSLGVPVLAVPGDVRDPLSEGTTGLLRDGARAVASAADVLRVIGGVDAAAERQLPLPALAGDEPAVLAALARRPRHADEVARTAGLPPGAALAGLLALEVLGLCEQRPGHYFLRRN